MQIYILPFLVKSLFCPENPYFFLKRVFLAEVSFISGPRCKFSAHNLLNLDAIYPMAKKWQKKGPILKYNTLF